MKTLSNLFGDARGNVATMTALTLVMVIGGVGVAVDHSRASSLRMSLQNYADAAALAAAKRRTEDDQQLVDLASMVVDDHNTKGLALTTTTVVHDDYVTVSIASLSDTTFLKAAGKSKIDVSVDSRAMRAKLQALNLALVVDATTSMQGDNVAALRTATNAMVDAMDKPGHKTRMSLVPFGQYVNVGTAEGKPGSRSWIEMGDTFGDTSEHCWKKSVEITAPTCETTGTVTYDDIRDGRNFGKKTRDKVECSGGEYEEGEEVCTTKTVDWHGCMGSRNGTQMLNPAAGGERIPAALDIHCGSPVVPLTADLQSIGTAVNSMHVGGATYMPTGLMWGWRTLEPSLPYNEVASVSVDSAKDAIIFMTDGFNTRQRGKKTDVGSHVHEYSVEDDNQMFKQVNDLTEEACDAIKDENIEIFVVGYKLPDNEDAKKGEEVLEKCASSKSHYFTPESAAELTADFLEVANMLDNTRLAWVP